MGIVCRTTENGGGLKGLMGIVCRTTENGGGLKGLVGLGALWLSQHFGRHDMKAIECYTRDLFFDQQYWLEEASLSGHCSTRYVHLDSLLVTGCSLDKRFCSATAK